MPILYYGSLKQTLIELLMKLQDTFWRSMIPIAVSLLSLLLTLYRTVYTIMWYIKNCIIVKAVCVCIRIMILVLNFFLGFPQDIYEDINAHIHPISGKWLYYRPGHEHRNLTPYHPFFCFGGELI